MGSSYMTPARVLSHPMVIWALCVFEIIILDFVGMCIYGAVGLLAGGWGMPQFRIRSMPKGRLWKPCLL